MPNLTWPCSPRALFGMRPDPWVGTELGYESDRMKTACPYTYWLRTHFCTDVRGPMAACRA